MGASAPRPQPQPHQRTQLWSPWPIGIKRPSFLVISQNAERQRKEEKEKEREKEPLAVLGWIWMFK